MNTDTTFAPSNVKANVTTTVTVERSKWAGDVLDRKAAIKDFKERKVSRGVFAVRCTSNGKVWVGSSPNLDATRNGLWFMLRMGTHHAKDLQAEWNAHGEPSFTFQVVSRLEDDTHALAVSDRLKEEKEIWASKLDAKTIL